MTGTRRPITTEPVGPTRRPANGPSLVRQLKRQLRRPQQWFSATMARREARTLTRETPRPARRSSSRSTDTNEVHPRIAQRLAEVSAAPKGSTEARREWNARRVLRWSVLGVLSLGTVAAGLLFSPLADLDQLSIEGVSDGPAEAVGEATNLTTGTAMFGIRASEVRSRVEATGWVAHANVEVSWPNRVTVEVTPHRPLAVLASTEGSAGGSPVLLTATGELLDADQAGPLIGFAPNLPEVDIGAGDQAGADAAAGVFDELRGVTRGALVSLRVNGDRSAVLTLDAASLPGAAEASGADSPSSIEVAMGDLGDLPAKSLAVESMLAGTVERACMERIDVSVPTRVTVQRAAGCTMPGGEPAKEVDQAAQEEPT